MLLRASQRPFLFRAQVNTPMRYARRAVHRELGQYARILRRRHYHHAGSIIYDLLLGIYLRRGDAERRAAPASCHARRRVDSGARRHAAAAVDASSKEDKFYLYAICRCQMTLRKRRFRYLYLRCLQALHFNIARDKVFSPYDDWRNRCWRPEVVA